MKNKAVAAISHLNLTERSPSRTQWAFCVLLILPLSGCSSAPPEKEPVVPVQAVTVRQTTIQHVIKAEAILFPLQQSAIVPKITAPVKTFYVSRGAHVRQGQLLATLENKDLAAAAQDTKGSYDQAQAAYRTTTAADLPETIQKAQLDAQAAKQLMDAQEKVYKSRQELFKQGAMPRKELDQSGVDLTSARNQYQIARKHLQSLTAIGEQQALKSAAGQLESAKGKYAGAEAQLSYSEIRSPISGVIADRPLYPGEMATAGTPLITVMDVSQVIARSHIPQQDAALLKIGDKATISAPGLNQPVQGKVTVISPALDPNSTTVEVWVQARNPKESLRPGSSVEVSMLVQTVPNALVIPASGLLTAQDGTTSVMVIGDDGRAHEKNVRTGIKQGSQVQIVEGLQAGERVASEGAYGLPDNSKVEVQQPGQSQNKPETNAPNRESQEPNGK
ncbi:MAG: efflux RND transporter periplasmic adaptor subunit [Terriglobales bacterium]